MSEPLSGYKAYLVGASMIIFGGIGAVMEWMDKTQATTLVMNGFGIIALRLGIAKAE